MSELKLKAHDLKYSKAQISDIEACVKNILASIDDSIEEAHNNGQVNVEVSLPFAFDVTNMNQLDSRKKIYSLIVEDLTSPQRGFMVRLYMKPDSSRIFITWMTEEDELLREHEKEIIEFYSLPWAERKNKTRPNSLQFSDRIKYYK